MLWAGMILHAEKRQQIPESGSRGYGGHNGQKEIQLSRGQDGDSQPREIGGIRCGKIGATTEIRTQPGLASISF